MRTYANYYKKGSWNVKCARTGFKIKAEDARQEWNGLIVRRESWEPRQPQDYVKGVPDNPAVPLARPRPAQVLANSPNLLFDPSGDTADGIYWDLSDWSLNGGDGWQVTSFPTSTDLVTARSKDIVIGPNETVLEGDTLTLSSFVTLEGRTAGSIAWKARFYEADRTTVVSTDTFGTLSSDSAGARQSGVSVVVPDATYLQILFDTDSLAATKLELRDIKLEIGPLTGFGEKVTF